MNPQAAQNYLRTRVMTATPEQLQMMLYDGAIRFAESARPALEKQDWEASFKLICKAQNIVAELTATLKHDINPDMCGRLAALYNYVYRKLIEANTDHTIESLDEAVRILRFQRQTWALLMAKLGQQKAAAAVSKLDVPAPDPRMEASISVQG